MLNYDITKGSGLKLAKVNRFFKLNLIQIVKKTGKKPSGFTKFRKPCQKGRLDLYTAVIFEHLLSETLYLSGL